MNYNKEISLKMLELGIYKAKVLDTGLFIKFSYSSIFESFVLTKTNISYYPAGRMWHVRSVGYIDFEEVLEMVDEETRTQLLFHLDLFT